MGTQTRPDVESSCYTIFLVMYLRHITRRLVVALLKTRACHGFGPAHQLIFLYLAERKGGELDIVHEYQKISTGQAY